MPTYGEEQKAAGVDKSPPQKPLDKRTMKSRNRLIEPTLSIDNVPYKGNAVLNANR